MTEITRASGLARGSSSASSHGVATTPSRGLPGLDSTPDPAFPTRKPPVLGNRVTEVRYATGQKGGAVADLARQGSHLFLLSAGIQVASNALTQIARGRIPGVSETFGFLGDASFWRSTAGVAAGAWAGSKLVQLAGYQSLVGGLATTSPLALRVALLLPAFVLGAAGGELAAGHRLEPGKLLLESLGAAAGTALAMSFLPGAGLLGQLAGGLVGGWIVKKLLGDRDPDAVAAGPGEPSAVVGIPPSLALPAPPPRAPAGASVSAADRTRREIYSRLVEALEENRSDDAQRLLAEYRGLRP